MSNRKDKDAEQLRKDAEQLRKEEEELRIAREKHVERFGDFADHLWGIEIKDAKGDVIKPAEASGVPEEQDE